MKNILLIGAGLSASYLIRYLLEHAEAADWNITLADADIQTAQRKTENHARATATQLSADDTQKMNTLVSASDLVISLLPATLHIHVARICISQRKHLITASYLTDEMRSLHLEALKSDVLLLNECGLDPGIDHMSAMKIIHGIQSAGGTITSFKSYCGGLIAPASDNNPWHYKFTWNPRNVVLAGQNTARYLENKELKFIPASRIFSQVERITINTGEVFECYANRDSLEYIHPYGIQSAHTVLRGTMRGEGFCEAWNAIARLGLNDDTFRIHEADKLTYRQWLSAFTPGIGLAELENRVASFLQIARSSELFSKLEWLGLFSENRITQTEATPAQILQELLQQKWKLEHNDLDRIVMHHVIGSQTGSEHTLTTSSLIVTGENNVYTAMSKTVGLPLGIIAKNLLSGNIRTRGVQIPVLPEIYNPVLNELGLLGIRFTDSVSE